MQYFEETSDPLKEYFQEKASALFLRRDVLKIFIAEDNREKHPEIECTQYLSESFARSADEDGEPIHLQSAGPSIFSSPVPAMNSGPPYSQRDPVTDYDARRRIKQIQGNYMMRVNDELQSSPESFRTNLVQRLERIDQIEAEVGGALEEQVDTVRRRVLARRMGSLREASKNTGHGGSVIGSPIAMALAGKDGPNVKRMRRQNSMSTSNTEASSTPNASFDERGKKVVLPMFAFQTEAPEK